MTASMDIVLPERQREVQHFRYRVGNNWVTPVTSGLGSGEKLGTAPREPLDDVYGGLVHFVGCVRQDRIDAAPARRAPEFFGLDVQRVSYGCYLLRIEAMLLVSPAPDSLARHA